MNNSILFKELIFQTKYGAYKIFSALYNAESCFCITHEDDSMQYTVIFDYNESILKKLIDKINLTSIVMEKKGFGSKFLFKFAPTEGEKSVSLRNYLWAEYNNSLVSETVGHKIELIDKTSYQFNVMDMRKCNMYDAGGIDLCGIYTHTDTLSQKNFIIVEDSNRFEFADFSPELYQLLTSRRYCSRSRKGKNGRLHISLHCNRGHYVIRNLAKATLLFYDFLNKKNTEADFDCSEFLRTIPELEDSSLKDKECAHINDCNWNNCVENLVFMDKKINQRLRRNSKLLANKYKMRPIIWHSSVPFEGSKILVEWEVDGNLSYYVFNDEYCYLDFEETILGKNPMIRNLSIRFYPDNQKSKQILTPKECIPSSLPKMVSPNMTEIKSDIEDWSSFRERILDLYQRAPEIFQKWENKTAGIPMSDLIQGGTGLTQLLNLFGFSFQ